MTATFELFRDICIAHGFKQKKHSFFRVYGDGVLQVLKYEFKTRPFWSERIWLGLFSMYGELQKQWFTNAGCIPRYDSRYIKIPEWQRCPAANSSTLPLQIAQPDDLEDVLIFHLDCSEIETDILPFLNRVDSQTQLCVGLDYLERQSSPVIPQSKEEYFRWNDFEKFAPFLAAGLYEEAEHTICSILAQHQSATTSDSIDHTSKLQKDLELFQKLAIVHQRNIPAIHDYLKKNYEINRHYASKAGLLR